MALIKNLTRVVVIGGLATGATVLIAGPDRVGALFEQARDGVVSQIDQHIEDPVLLRKQLRELESAYPARIAEVRSELVDVREQIAELEREKQVAQRVVDLTTDELAEFQPLIERAEAQRSAHPSRSIVVSFGGDQIPLEEVYEKAAKASSTLAAYRENAGATERNIALLSKQAGRLGDLLGKLESERAELRSRLWQLNTEIEMIARNERLIDITENRQRVIDEYERFEAASLDQVTSRINKIRAEQEARLESLAEQRQTESYEERARAMLEAEAAARDVWKRSLDDAETRKPETGEEPIVVSPDDNTAEPDRSADRDANDARPAAALSSL